MKNNQQGFTLFEVILGIMIAGLCFYLMAQLQSTISRNQAALVKKLEIEIDTSLAEKMIYSDLKSMSQSYNNLLIKDDSGNLFFDFYSDVAEASLVKEPSRKITLTENNDIVFITQSNRDGSVLIYDAISAYQIGPKPNDFSKGATLDFISLNNNDWLKSQRPFFWENGKLLLLDTSARIRRSIDAFGKVDMQTPAKSPIYIGKVQGSNLLDLDSSIRSKVDFTHPQDGTNIANVDQFLRKVPTSGGGIPVIRVLSVNIIRYYLENQNSPQYPNAKRMMKSTYDGSQFTNAVTIAHNVDSVVFRRDSVTEKIVHFVVNKID